jgi:hypothetical protein
VCKSPVSHTCHMPRPSHSSWFDHPNVVCWAIMYHVERHFKCTSSSGVWNMAAGLPAVLWLEILTAKLCFQFPLWFESFFTNWEKYTLCGLHVPSSVCDQTVRLH